MKASENARNIAAIVAAGEGVTDLYRTIVAGPSGQHADLLVGRIRYQPEGNWEFAVIDPRDNETAGFARRDNGRWSITARDYSGALEWLGWASSLAVGVDVLVNSEHAALGRHDHRRITSGTFTKGTRP